MADPKSSAATWLSRLVGRRRPARPAISAYLSIFNDWDLLAPALAALAPHVEELVVVDGAYGWMVPYLARLGIAPERSDARVYEALAASGIPFRVVSGRWAHEIDKRRAGYEACRNRYALRVDADEILHVDEAALAEFFASGAAVAEMENPTYVAPGFVQGDEDRAQLPRTGCLFDRDQVSADVHLNYIWLVLTKDELPSAGQKPFPVFERKIAFSAHLTGWRTPDTAEQRSAFYALNRLRKTGVGWFEDLKGRPLEDFEPLFSRVSAHSFRNMLRHARFSLGTFSLSAGQTLARSPLGAEQEAAFAPLYERFLESLAQDNFAARTTAQAFGWGGDVFLDLSSPAAYDALVREGAVRVEFSSPVSGLDAKAHLLGPSAPHSRETALAVTIDRARVCLEAPPRPDRDLLRLALSMRPFGGDGPLGGFRIL